MSATLDPTIFQEYYKHISSDIPVIKIPGRTYPVKEYFNSGENYIETIATHYKEGENILFFVPGKKEIDANIELLRKKLGKDAEILPLHADLPKEEQQKLLNKATDKPRIIVCTNVAEESITIPYIYLSMDLGTHKVARFNHLGIEELRLENTSKANCKQRAGRAGRTKPWIYIRTNDTPFDELSEYPEAPIEREMLDNYILILLANGIDIVKCKNTEARGWRKLFFHDFDQKLLDISYYRLKQIGAIDQSRNITPLGRDLLKLPLDVYYARMLREAIKRKCTEDIMYATAILDKKWFVSKEGKWKEIKMLGGNESDLFGYVELFKLVTATTLSKGKIDLLFWLGADEDEMRDFVDRGGEYKLYELVNLAPLGIKNKKVWEIDDLVNQLRDRLQSSGIEITASDNVNDKKICLASGSLHNVFTYDFVSKKFRNRSHKVWKDTLYFRAGNVTLVKPIDRHLYLGIPFIIGWQGEEEDFNILTFLTQVDEGLLHNLSIETQHFMDIWKELERKAVHGNKWQDIKKWQVSDIWAVASKVNRVVTGQISHISTQKSWSMSIKENVDESIFKEIIPPAWNRKDAVEGYMKALDEYSDSQSSNCFETDTEAREYYIRYCLPDFLIAHNVRIGKYLKNKTAEQIFTFRGLLVRFLLNDVVHRVNPDNIEKTERSFRHDTTILDRFLESKDPFIEAFRSGKQIVVPSGEKELIMDISHDEDAVYDNELFQSQKQYVQFLGSIRHGVKPLNVDKIKSALLSEYFLSLATDSDAYKKLWIIYQDIGRMDVSDVQNLTKCLKWKARKEKAIKSIQDEKRKILNIIAELKSLTKGKRIVDLELLCSYKFWKETSESYVEKYHNAIELAKSKAPKKREKGLLYIGWFIQDFRKYIRLSEKGIKPLLEETNLSSDTLPPLLRNVFDVLEHLCKDFFEIGYYNTAVSKGILEIARQIVRDQITEKTGLKKILFDFFLTKDFARTKVYNKIFKEIDDYIDVVDVIGTYSWAILQEVKETRDTAYIRQMTEELKNKFERLQSVEKGLNKLKVVQY